MGWFRELLTVYSTTRVVQIKSKFLAITYVTLVALVWSAILKSYQLDLRKIYQKRCPVRGTFTTKVKGVLTTENYTEDDLHISSSEQYRRLWDTQDLIIPGEAEFTVMTNIIITPNQKRELCPSNSAHCKTDEDCPMGVSDPSFDGILTGYCDAQGKCQVSAWCPTEEDVLPLNGSIPLLRATKTFTVLVKTSVEFPDCEDDQTFRLTHKEKAVYKRRNILSNFSGDYLTYCRYDPNKDPFCPIFRLKDIVNWSNQNYDEVGVTTVADVLNRKQNLSMEEAAKQACLDSRGRTEHYCTTYKKIKQHHFITFSQKLEPSIFGVDPKGPHNWHGGIFGIVVHWDCDFDWGNTIKDCLPKYIFTRIDVLEANSLAPGFNWRSAVFFEGNRRTLTKYYGLKFVVKITGEGRKFDFLLLVLAIGASIGLFSLAPLFCDFLFDLFCYLKSLRGFNRIFSESFNKETRYQSILPQIRNFRQQTPSPFSNNRRDVNNSLFTGQTEYSTPLSYDTKL